MQKIAPNTKLYRSETDRMIAGVCGGIAAYFGIDSSLVRLAFIAIILLGGSGLLAYLILWLILPSASDINQEMEDVVKKNANELKSAAESVSKEVSETTKKSSKSIWGIFLIGFGVLMLLQNYGFAHYLQLDKTWPIILVALGFLVLAR